MANLSEWLSICAIEESAYRRKARREYYAEQVHREALAAAEILPAAQRAAAVHQATGRRHAEYSAAKTAYESSLVEQDYHGKKRRFLEAAQAAYERELVEHS